MYQYFNAITNTKGDALSGYYVAAVVPATGINAAIYSDASSTPISVVSGLANKARVDSDGNATFFVPSGTYHLDIYGPDGSTKVKRISNVAMQAGIPPVGTDGQFLGADNLNATATWQSIDWTDITGTPSANAALVALIQSLSGSGSGLVNTTPPTISGALTTGATLTVTPGVWPGSPTLTHQWKRNGVAISGATGLTYVTVTADVGQPITVTETAYLGTLSSSVTSASVMPGVYTGPVATRAFANSLTANTSNMMSRTAHKATDTISQLRLVFAGWRVTAAGDVDQPNGATWRAAIEYPSGTIAAQVLFGGSASGAAASGANLVSDLVNVSIPDGAEFFVRAYQVASTDCLYRQVVSSGGNSAKTYLSYGAGTTDQTMTTGLPTGGTVTANLSSGPVAIIGQTAKATVAIIGDSRSDGTGDDNGADATTGTPGGLFATLDDIGYIAMPITSASAANSVGTTAQRRRSVASYCTHLLNNMGINDLSGGTAASLIANQQTIATEFGKPMVCPTLDPRSSSTDAWATTANQTTDASNAQRISYNNTVRSLPSWLNNYIESADVTESARDSGKWHTGYTADGLHCNGAGYDAVKTSGVFQKSRFIR